MVTKAVRAMMSARKVIAVVMMSTWVPGPEGEDGRHVRWARKGRD